MDQLAQLLGSSTRANLIASLALASAPMTAYRVARLSNMNVARTYLEMKRLAKMRLVEVVSGRGGTRYVLTDADLRKLALRLSPRVTSLESWRSEEARVSRFRGGLRALPGQGTGGPRTVRLSKPTRMPGELQVLARISGKAFDSKYKKVGERIFGHV